MDSTSGRLAARDVLRWRAAVAFLVLSSFARLAAGQDAASIIGQVTDESGAVLPGVTVTATSPALQTPSIVAVTDERGEYRLTPLPIGVYAVSYDLGGFSAVRREGLRLTVGFIVKVDVSLKVGALEESITVSGATPVVDVTSTATASRLTRETLELTPTGRVGFAGVLAQAPGVRGTFDIGGSSGGSPTYRAFGQQGDPWPLLEGVLTTSPKTSDSGNYFDFASIEEANVQTVGTGAEQPTKGLALSAIVKSGGNDFHGGTWWQQNNSNFQSDNIDDELRAQGVNNGGRIVARYMVNGDLGGRLIRNKLWFYAGVTFNRNNQEVLGATPQPNGDPAVTNQLYHYVNQKYSYQMSKANRLVFFQQWGVKRITRDVTQFRPWESRMYQFLHGQTIKGEWQSVPTNTVVISAQSGVWQWHSPFFSYSDEVAKMDTATLYESGSNASLAWEDPLERNFHNKGSVSWFRPDLFMGNHEFKAGFDHVSALISRKRASRSNRSYLIDDGFLTGAPVEDYRLLYRNGVPFQITTWNYPVIPETRSNFVGTYVKDTWIIARRVTLDAGIRFATDKGFIPAQCRVKGQFAEAQCWPANNDFKRWNSFAPRIHAAFDVTGDGKTVVKGGWGRFDHKRLIDPEILQANPNVQIAINWTWHDLNGDKLYQPGEVNLDPNGADFVGFSGSGNSTFSNAVPNPNEKQPKEDEYMVSVERELMPNFGVRVTGVYTKTFNNYALNNNKRPYESYTIPITRPDPGPDGVITTTADNGGLFTYYEYPAALRGLAFEQGMLINDPKNDQNYKSIEFSANKRLSDNWQFLMSYAATKKNIPIGSGLYAYNPNSEINSGDSSVEWLGLFSGAYMFPREIVVSAAYEIRSGTVFARQVQFAGGNTIPTFVMNVEPNNARQLPALDHLDMRVEKRFRVGATHRAAVRLNVFNVTNRNTETGVTIRSGATFLRPTGIISPRIAEISASYTF